MQESIGDSNQTQSSRQAEHTTYHESQRRPNRLRACIACRNTKTRCIPLESRSVCKSCYQHSRECVMPGPIKPRTKARPRLLELERKVQLLTEALTIKDTLHQNNLHEGSSSDDVSSPFRRNGDIDACDMSRRSHPPNAIGVLHSSPKDTVLWWNTESSQVSVLFNHWALKIRPLLPLVGPLGDNLHLLRSTKPLLFISVLTVASLSAFPATSSQLMKHLNEEIARHIYVNGDQSVDLVQALLLSSHYFAPLGKSTNFAFIQHAYTASSISFDIGLNRQARSSSGLADVEQAEAARTWLSVYYTMSISATLLRRQRLVFDGMETTAIMAELLENPSVTASDRTLCSLVRLQTIVEDTSMTMGQISCDREIEFDKPSTQYHLIALRQRLDQWKESISEELESSFMSHAYHSAKLYLHQIAIRAYIRKIFSPSREPLGVIHDPNLSLSTMHIDALGICLESSQKVFYAFTCLDSATLRCLPSFYLVWTLFAAVCIVKIAPYVEHQQNLRSSRTTVERGIYGLHSITQLLDSAVQKLGIGCENDYMSHGKLFLTAFQKLRTWYLEKSTICLNARQGEHGAGNRVHNLLAHEPGSISQSSGESYTSSGTVARPKVVPPLGNDTMNQKNIPVQGPRQEVDTSMTNDIWQSGFPVAPNHFDFPIEASRHDNTFSPVVDPNSGGPFLNSETQLDESMFTLNEQWLRTLLGLDEGL
ncbi:hypothetical protein BGZ60DRAFT_146075 [Tricladium varicosporioides]|nr:hypothetical protein BGZ60DRAFT_146075 [Hymenoscyphus varicosporioides]